MNFKFPKEDAEFCWTRHAAAKMREYGLSAAQVKKIARRPERTERGVAEGTVAAMQTTKAKKRPTEIWLMYKIVGGKKKIIAAWRYPGISPKGEEIPMPEGMREMIG